MFNPAVLRLYLVLDPDLVGVDRAAGLTRDLLDAGVTCVQLRWKSATDRQLVAMARTLQPVCRAANVPLIVNDRLDIALAAEADGVHLGAEDLPVEDARRIAPDGFIVGYSPESDDDLVQVGGTATYLGIGPFHATSTKSDAGPALGSAEFARRRTLTPLPVVAIGGIGLTNATEPMAAGADGIAVVSAILSPADPVQAARQLSQVLARRAT